MKYAYVAAAILPMLVAGQPAEHHHHKRDVVTNVVHATRVLYQNQVVYVDQNGNPWKTEVEPVSTGVNVAQPTSSEAPAPAPATTATSEAPAAVTTTTQQPPVAEQQQPATSEAQPQQPETSSPAAPQSSSQPQQQQPSSSPQQPQQPTTQVQKTSSAAPSPSPSAGGSGDSGSDSGSGESFEGDATYYTPGMGACGESNTEKDYIVALNINQFESDGAANPNFNSYCGKRIRIERGDKHVDVAVADMCPGCSHGSLDLSPAAFDEIADQAEGRVKINWKWIN